MTRAARWLLLAGLLLFLALLAWHGVTAVLSALSIAGWALLLLVPFHLLPLVIDALAMTVLFDRGTRSSSLRNTTLTRWVGESVNSLMPAGQLGGPVLMARQLAQRGSAMPVAAAVVTVATTYQLMAQMLFALAGLGLLGSYQHSQVLLISVAVLCAIAISFYLTQRRGMFQKLAGVARRFFGPERMAGVMGQAETLDIHVRALYARRLRGAGSLAASLVGWIVGTGEVYLILHLMKAHVSWETALLLESLGQAVRGAAFAIPGSLGVQEGGYLLLAPFAGLSADTALALSLAKRAREVLLGLPGLLYLHLFERRNNGAAARTEQRTIL
jgi:putative membrane protein